MPTKPVSGLGLFFGVVVWLGLTVYTSGRMAPGASPILLAISSVGFLVPACIVAYLVTAWGESKPQ